MNAPRFSGRRPLGAVIGLWLACAPLAPAQSPESDAIRIVELAGTVELMPAGARTWVRTQTNQTVHPSDRLRTGPDSRVALRWSDRSVVPFGALTEIEILPPHEPGAQAGLHLIRGVLSFFHRDRPGRIRVITRGAVAGIDGTEFVIAVEPAGDSERTTLSVIDGRVRFGNEQAELLLTNGQQAVVIPGQAPQRTAGFIANNVLQWCFYYPAVLELRDLPLTVAEAQTLGESLSAYRKGDLLAALALYPAGRQPASDAERVYHAALLLSVGQIGPAETELAALAAGDPSGRLQRLATALRQLIAAVKRGPNPATIPPELATEFLAASYHEQSRGVGETSLKTALNLAREAAGRAPESGFAQVRVAELEFSFGHTGRASAALEKALAQTPRNAQALALKGFLLAARNQTREAIEWFNQALAADSALGNAWLGRGLCRIRRGDTAGGREDLLIAAALEPQRSLLRSYLGKAWSQQGDHRRARHELELARTLDPADPTAWLYSALVNEQENRINEAIRDLEKSQALNDNRRVYRSQLLLDQDRAVRSANLARIYQDAGMDEVAVREAGRAVAADYANYSAHLFLAESYNSIRDPQLTNLRYDTPANTEYLVANLLAPVGAGTLSPALSQQEYSKLLERDRLGLIASGEYLSSGDWTLSGAQHGLLGNSSYSLEGYYRTQNGQRPNNDFEQRRYSLRLKQQLTPADSVFFEASLYQGESGDLAQYHDPTNAATAFRLEEKQEPLLAVGYHHEWSPGIHTLMLASRLSDESSFTNPAQPTYLVFRTGPDVNAAHGLEMHQNLATDLEIYSAELQQVFQAYAHSTILGTRLQYGSIDTRNYQTLPSRLASAFPDPPEPAAVQSVSADFKRWSTYGYHHWQALDSLQLVAGLAYDWIEYPENPSSAPVSSGEDTLSNVSPKAGFIWQPFRETVLRFAYTRSVSGASLEQSFQLEPTQVAGFLQSYRSIIPEAVAGAVAGARFETLGFSFEQKLPTATYLAVSGELLNSQVRRTLGAFGFDPDETEFAGSSGLRQHLDYRERSLLVTLNQLVGDELALGARYRLTQAELDENFPDVPAGAIISQFTPRQSLESVLHQLTLQCVYNHSSGFFGRFQALWNHQHNFTSTTNALPNEDFWQFHLLAGYRFARRRAEVTIGLLNIGDQDYRLNPLTLYSELPRERTFVTRLRFNF